MSCAATAAGPISSEHVNAFVDPNDLWCRFLTLLRLTIVYTVLHDMAPHHITSPFTTLHRIHYIALHYIELLYITQQ